MKRLLLLGLLTAPLALAQTDAGTDTATAYFAAGCFWSTESGFEGHEGVLEVVSGYMGGILKNPTYEDVVTETTEHRETVEVRYDPNVISYQNLLDIFWRLHDPSDAGGAFFDRGESYTSAIFYTDKAQQRLAEGAKEALEASGKFDDPIATTITAADTFYRRRRITKTSTKPTPNTTRLTAPLRVETPFSPPSGATTKPFIRARSTQIPASSVQNRPTQNLPTTYCASGLRPCSTT